MSLPTTSTVFASQAMVCTIDQLASAAALEILNKGGNAVDAAIAANAVSGDHVAAHERTGRRPVGVDP